MASSDGDFVWLPSMKVWAFSPSAAAAAAAAASAPSSSSSSSHNPKVSPVRGELDHPPIERLEEAIREKTCPICLGRVEERRAAVVRGCLHAFCVGCIRRWSEFRRSCPLCNREFDRWFRDIKVLEHVFEEEKLPALPEKKDKAVVRGERSEIASRRLLNEARHRIRSVNQRSRPLRWRRSFERSRNTVLSERQRLEEAQLVRERALRWRSSIYKQGLKSIPSHVHSKHSPELGTSLNVVRVKRDLESWIARELKAILGDSDPSVLVHFVTSLWLSACQGHNTSLRSHVEGSCIDKLRPFLHEQADLFWHELRFVSSTFSQCD
ncbi:Topors E3 ubiquitin-protein ligase [Nymphaea thermarum]|nr:Topors E3 ubiquitin-protein ligase [Nymphaea thermarum]